MLICPIQPRVDFLITKNASVDAGVFNACAEHSNGLPSVHAVSLKLQLCAHPEWATDFDAWAVKPVESIGALVEEIKNL